MQLNGMEWNSWFSIRDQGNNIIWLGLLLFSLLLLLFLEGKGAKESTPYKINTTVDGGLLPLSITIVEVSMGFPLW